MPSTTEFRVRPLEGAPFGAEVTGADLGALTDRGFAHIERALAGHVILVFRGQQDLSPEDQIAFSRRFGTLLPPQFARYTLPGYRDIGVVSNARDDAGAYIGIPNSGRNWHTDVQFDRTPPDATLLVSRELPAEGGDTLYADMFAAYDALSAAERTRLDGLRVIHSRNKSWQILYPDRDPLPPEEQAKHPDVSHPLVRTHPVNGRKALWLGGNMAVGIEGMEEKAATALIEALRAHSVEDRFVYAHRWREGDAVLWDNRCALHCATWYDDAAYRRVMHRTSFAPAVPV